MRMVLWGKEVKVCVVDWFTGTTSSFPVVYRLEWEFGEVVLVPVDFEWTDEDRTFELGAVGWNGGKGRLRTLSAGAYVYSSGNAVGTQKCEMHKQYLLIRRCKDEGTIDAQELDTLEEIRKLDILRDNKKHTLKRNQEAREVPVAPILECVQSNRSIFGSAAKLQEQQEQLASEWEQQNRQYLWKAIGQNGVEDVNRLSNTRNIGIGYNEKLEMVRLCKREHSGNAVSDDAWKRNQEASKLGVDITNIPWRRNLEARELPVTPRTISGFYPVADPIYSE
ncbi:hypothetical protein FIBSPDRAFT_888649 [Athelia psychrophila]|uniref:Uncharacterized protein n=1 Tax=Athelia psychrophila TaxID=1759441 RepID=A0A166NDN6_9AGAM|nr:hypothetical protein FIBSPDRAFT_888649 [Fibularhizoctonia sp. CBS 109695]